jgi:hypothetical protein
MKDNFFWEETNVIRFVRNCGAVGLLVPVVLYPLWQSVNNGTDLQSKVTFEHIVLILWPSSIFLMALEGSGGGIFAAIIVLLSLVVNAVVYGCFGLLLWGIRRAWKYFAASC